MNKFLMAKLFVKRMLRSSAFWAILITLTFCAANYYLLKQIYLDLERFYVASPHQPQQEPRNLYNDDSSDYDYDFEDNSDQILKDLIPFLEHYYNTTLDEKNYGKSKIIPFQNPYSGVKYTPTSMITGNNKIPKNDENLLNVAENKINSPGEMGKPFIIPKELLAEKERRFPEFQLNIIASDLISVNRSLQDNRILECRNKIYPEELPSASIIIIFRNEAWSTLIRTIWSIINRTPRKLLKEIILVDDASELDFLGQPLDDYVGKLAIPIKVLRMDKRSGLIKGRLYGVENAIGAVIIFLDAHCECNEGWIEPLLARIATNPRSVVAPVIDIIDDETFEYQEIYPQLGGFDWILDFKWMEVPKREFIRLKNDLSEPIQTPTIAGGLVAIDKQFFYDIGGYDDEMNIWGAENLEMSFRVWQCGGVLELLQCSRIGHVFRRKTPHSFPDGERSTIFGNKARVAEVWMDKYKEIFFALNPDVTLSNVTKRKELRERLNCKSFEWYLKNIYPETNVPLEYDHFGLIQNLETKECIVVDDLDNTGRIQFMECSTFHPKKLFIYEKNKKIQWNDICLRQSYTSEVEVVHEYCLNEHDAQNWFYDNETNHFINLKTAKCLMQTLEDKINTTNAILQECDRNSTRQQWLLLPKEFSVY